jgi:outer membrane protein
MKKILTILALGATLASVSSADAMRLEMGGGVWQQTPKGYATRTDGDGVLNLNGTYTSSEKESSEGYAWLLFKHPVPIIPNVRLEYVSISDSGFTTGRVGGLPIPGSAATTIDIKEYDATLYYNVLDNTLWTTIDLGIDAKYMTSDATVNPVPGFIGYSSSDSVVLPFVYGRLRVEIPSTGIGLESDVKYITYDGSTMYDIRAKVDYTFDFDVVKPGIELGYRTQKLVIDDGTKTDVNLEYSGVYAGVILRF